VTRVSADTVLALPACAGCGASASTGARLPRGWKRASPSAVYCATCLAARYIHRSVTVPIAGPVTSGEHAATWPTFGAALRETWTQTTAAANWIVTELYTRDIRRPLDTPAAKLPAMRPVYLYPAARERFPGISPINLTSLLQQVERTYREQRYELLWTGTRSLAVHRYPVPAPLHRTAWRLHPADPGNGWTVVDVRLGDRWWGLRLRGGKDFARQTRQIAQLESGAAIPGAGALLAIPARPGDHRHAEGGRRVVIKLVGWFPVQTRALTGRDLVVTTAASDLLLVRVRETARPDLTGSLVHTIHGDALRRTIRAYETRRRRARAEGHFDVPSAQRQGDRIKTQCQQMAALVARLAVTLECGRVVYEDEEQGFCSPFPWTKFRVWLQSAVEGRGVTWQYASGQVGEPVAEPLAMAGSQEGTA
jgi:hypothetical protein